MKPKEKSLICTSKISLRLMELDLQVIYMMRFRQILVVMRQDMFYQMQEKEFVTLAFKDKKYTENVIYNKLLSDKLEANLGYVYENVVSQMLIAKGNNLFYYTMENETSNHLYEIDFLVSVRDKICPIEVKSGNYRSHKSLDVFCDKFSNRISDKYVVHTKDYKWENAINYIPVYMVPFL